MACTAQSMLSASTCAFLRRPQRLRSSSSNRPFFVCCSATSSPPSSSPDESDCNVEECAPEKEVGNLSVEWLAGERTKVVGTFPPKKRGWTGFVEKDTAGQTNIYSVEPTVYVAESAISSGTAGTSAEGSENTAAIAAGLALIAVASASSILLQVDKNQPPVQSPDYSGPPLSYYIGKFRPEQMVEASAAPEIDARPSGEASVSAAAPPEAQLDGGSGNAAPELQVGLKEQPAEVGIAAAAAAGNAS